MHTKPWFKITTLINRALLLCDGEEADRLKELLQKALLEATVLEGEPEQKIVH